MRLSGRMTRILFPLLLAAVTVIAYWPVTRAGFIWDDNDYLTENPIYTYSDALSRIWFKPTESPQWYPLVFTSFHIERKLWGLNPLGYHLVNVLLHAGSAILLWWVLKRLKVPGAAFAAAVFALHPIMVESVAWVTERKNTFSTFFFLASLLAFLAFIRPARRRLTVRAAAPAVAEVPRIAPPEPVEETRADGGRAWWLYGVSLVLFVLALLSKSVACGLAPVLVLILWWKRRPTAEYLLTLPYWVVGLVSGLFTAYLEQAHVGASGDAWQLSGVQKVLLAAQAILFYVWKLLLPLDLSFYYTRWAIRPEAWWQWLFPLAVAGIAGVLFALRRRIGRGPVAAAGAFFVLVFPALGFFPLYPMIFSWVADHFAYLATLAFIPAICAVATLLARRMLPGKRAMRAVIALPVLALLAAKTFALSMNFLDNETLFRSVLLYNAKKGEPPHWNALSIVSGAKHLQAMEAWERGDRDEALGLNEQAFILDKQSLEVYREAFPKKPEYAIGLNNIAGYYLFNRDFPRALEYAERAVAADPNNYLFLLTMGNIHRDMGERDKALRHYIEVVKIKPQQPLYRIKVARLLMELGRVELAREYLASVFKLVPGNAEAHLLQGYLFAQANEPKRAFEAFSAALAAAPENREIMDSFARQAAIYREATPAELDRAFALAQRNFLETQGTNFAYADTLAMMLHRANRNSEAIRLLQEAIPLVPPHQPDVREMMTRHLQAFSGGRTTIPATQPMTRPATQPG
jgi:tetratricopeptide (TPR) repeat protein